MSTFLGWYTLIIEYYETKIVVINRGRRALLRRRHRKLRTLQGRARGGCASELHPDCRFHIAGGEEARLAAIEATRQDSLARIEKFKESIPPFREIYLHFALIGNKYSDKVNLEELGFVKTVKHEKYTWDNGEEIETNDPTYRLELDLEHYCEIQERGGYECTNWIFKIVGFPELMNKYRAEARALESSSDFSKYSMGPSINIRKDEIQWVDGQ